MFYFLELINILPDELRNCTDQEAVQLLTTLGGPFQSEIMEKAACNSSKNQEYFLFLNEAISSLHKVT